MRKQILLLFAAIFSTLLVMAQSKTISGKVTDGKGESVPFATIKIKGAAKGTAADAGGFFSIQVSQSGNVVLVISSQGFEPQEVSVGTSKFLEISLKATGQQLQEVVVTTTALGMKRQAKELGYAATTISNKFLTQGKSVNVEQSLNGKVSGLNISTVNSSVFEDAKINIRGIRSLTGNNSPMLVIDGAPTPLGYLSSIPPDDVQDITILKSAASAAIYGPDAVNGVIIITTKRGNKKPTVTLTSSIQAGRVSFFPKFQKRFGAGAGEIIDQYGNLGYVPYENQQYGPEFDGSTQEIGPHLEDGSVQTGAYTNSHYKDKVKFWNNGVTFQNTISVAAEDFFLSVEDAKIKGLVPDDQNRRTSFRFNGGKKYGKFSVNYGLNYVLQNYDVVNEAGLAGLFNTSYNGGLFFLVMQTPSNVPLLDYKDWQNSKFAQYSNYYNEFALNPYWVIGNIRQKGRSDNLIGNLDLSYQILPWLKTTGRISSNLSFANFKNTTAPISVTDWALANRNSNQYINQKGNVFDDESFSSRVNFDYFLSGDQEFGKDFSLRYIAGGTIRNNHSKDVSVGGNNLVVPYLYNVAVRSGDAAVPVYPNGNYSIESSLLSAYGSFGVSYKGWASIEVTGRNDWDSRLLKENRSFFYPAANAALVLSDVIPGIKDSKYISYLKIRGAVSKSGNVNLNPYALNATYSQPAGYPYGNNVGFTANNTIPSTNLKPEFVNTTEAGIELRFLRNRISFEATYFNQKNTNQILAISQSSTTGYPTGLANAADFKNYGVEMDLGLTPLVNIGKGRIDLQVNATYNNNEILKTLNNSPVILTGTGGFTQISVGSPTVNNIAQVGSPAFAFQLTDYVRDSTTGKVIIDPNTGLPSQAQELVVKGRTMPTWIIGISPSFTLGNFSIGMTWDYKGGHNFYSGLGSDEDFAGISARSAEYGRQRFVFPNSVYWNGSKYVNNTSIQVQDGNYNFWTAAKVNTAIATNYFASAAAWKLREVNISYNLPIKWFGNGKGIKKFTVSAVGKNLLLFVPKSNQWGDPEFNFSATGNTFGVASSFQSPASRLFGASITIQF